MRRYRRDGEYVYDEHNEYVCRIDAVGGTDAHRREVVHIPAMLDALRGLVKADTSDVPTDAMRAAHAVLSVLKCALCAGDGYVALNGKKGVERCGACERFATDAEARGFHLAHLVLSFDGVEATSDVLKARRAAHRLVEEVEAAR